jgi:hypothetical protein
MARFEFDVKVFLDLLAEAVVEAAQAGKQFEADPDLLGPRLMTAAERVAADVMYLEALRDNRWVVARSPEDGRWRVWSGDTGKIVAGIKDGGDDWEDALDIAMIAKACAEAPRLSVSGGQGKR